MIIRNPPLKPGDVLRNRYEIQGLIGSGGYANVFRAFDLFFNRLVAVKLIDHGARRDRERRAKLEAVALDRIEHPNVVRTYDAGPMEGDWTFIVMELLHGPSFRAVLDHYGRLRPCEVVHLGAQIADGLHAIHQLNAVHRDVKPENVLIVGPGNVAVVIDLGVAKFELAEARTTQRDRIHGTIKYMCPEQLLGTGVTPLSDIFALGTLLYEALAGVHPAYIGLEIEDLNTVSYRQLSVPPPLLSDLVSDVPISLARTIQRMIAKDPEGRVVDKEAKDRGMPQDMAAVARVLRRHEKQIREQCGDEAMVQRNLWSVPFRVASLTEEHTTAPVDTLGVGSTAPAAEVRGKTPADLDTSASSVGSSSWRRLEQELETPSTAPQVEAANAKPVPTLRGYTSEVTPRSPTRPGWILSGVSRNRLFWHAVSSGLLVGSAASLVTCYAVLHPSHLEASIAPLPKGIDVATRAAAPTARAAVLSPNLVAAPHEPVSSPAAVHREAAAPVRAPRGAATIAVNTPIGSPARSARKYAAPPPAVPSAALPVMLTPLVPPRALVLADGSNMPSSGLAGDPPTQRGGASGGASAAARKGKTTATKAPPSTPKPLMPLFGPEDVE